MSKYKLVLLFVAISMFSSVSYALDEGKFFKAQKIFFAARAGSDGAVEKASNAFAKLDRKDPVVMVYKGAIKALEGRDSWMPWNKIGLVEDGLDIIDKALKKGGNSKKKVKDARYDILIKVVAASVMADLPGIFKRHQEAIDLHQELVELKEFASPDLKKHIKKIGKVLKKGVKK